MELNSNCILIAPVFGFEEVNSATCAKKFNSNWIIAQSDQTQSIISNVIIGTMSENGIKIEDEPVAVNINGIVNVNGRQADKFKWIACSDTKPLISADCTRRDVNNPWLASLIFDENVFDKVDSCPESYEDGPTTITNKQDLRVKATDELATFTFKCIKKTLETEYEEFLIDQKCDDCPFDATTCILMGNSDGCFSDTMVCSVTSDSATIDPDSCELNVALPETKLFNTQNAQILSSIGFPKVQLSYFSQILSIQFSEIHVFKLAMSITGLYTMD